MGKVSNEKDGFINLNVRVHREDIEEAIAGQLDYDNDDDKEQHREIMRKLTKKKFKEIAERMANEEPFCGGDAWTEACRDAYHVVME